MDGARIVRVRWLAGLRERRWVNHSSLVSGYIPHSISKCSKIIRVMLMRNEPKCNSVRLYTYGAQAGAPLGG